jgi:excisionase family DNA binding protein
MLKSEVSKLVIEPLLVKPKIAWKMLACGNTKGYELLAAGELDSFRDGRSRKITVESIHRYIQRRLTQEQHLPNKSSVSRAAP